MEEKKINRTPPRPIRQQLRKEVGFGCPIPDCGNPYLYWHHFDPPWSEKNHHNPEGMIALCGEHHSKADAGAYTKEQLQSFKLLGAEQNKKIKGRFDWMRNALLIVVGGAFFYETDIPFKFRNKPIIWFNRDKNGYLLLNVSILTEFGQSIVLINDNDWYTNDYPPEDLECPPNGKLLKLEYENGDKIKIEFIELVNTEAFKTRYPQVDINKEDKDITLEFPLTLVEIYGKTGGGRLEFTPKKIKFGPILFENQFFVKGTTFELF